MKNTEIVKKESQFSIETLLEKAVENKVDVGTMEKLLNMRKQLKEEWAKEKYFEALSNFQNELPVLKKTSVVKNKDGSVRYKYTPLEDIITQTKDLIKKHGFSYYIDSKIEGGYVVATCKVFHLSGHSETSQFFAPIDNDAYMNAPQKVASALTYAKRYAFCNAFGILTADEDDDTSKTFNQEKPVIKTNQATCQHEWKEFTSKTSGKKYRKCLKCQKFEWL